MPQAASEKFGLHPLSQPGKNSHRSQYRWFLSAPESACIIALPMLASFSVWTLSLCTGLLLTAMLPAQAPAEPPASSSLQKAQAPNPPVNLPRFEDVAQKAGLTVPHISSPDKKYIVESMSGGVGLIDCDNDGKLDIITVNGSTVQRYKQGGDLMITLYHQDTDPTE